jgi:K+-sensing histidine kinase KdpD
MGASVKPEVVIGPAPSRAKALRSGVQHSVVREDLSGLLAHDLKTPLSAIAMNVDFILAELEAGAADSIRSALEDCRSANARAIRIVSDMADVARLATGDYRPTLTDFCPRSIIEHVAAAAAKEAEAREVRIAWSSSDDIVVAEPELLSRALDRLVERALRSARPASCLRIDYRAGVLTVRAQTSATGRGEPPARALAIWFAQAAIEALGGTLDTEAAGEPALVYRLSLLTP